MAVTGLQAEALVTHALDGDPVGRTAIDLANDAGRLLFGARGWRWLDGAMVELDFTADQDYVALPADFRSMVTLDHVDAANGFFKPTSLDELSRLRSLDPIAGPPFYGAITHDLSSPGEPGARISIYPTPGANTSPALRLTYKRGWADYPSPANSTEAILPKWMELLYLEFCKAVARGHSDDLSGPSMASAYIAAVMDGPIWEAAVTQDTELQPHYGVPTNGFLDPATTYWNPVADVLDA